MKSKDLKFIIVFIVIVTLSLLYLFQTSYAKFRKKVVADVNSSIAKWNIKVNNESINGKNKLTNSITPVFIETEHSKEGVIAPSSKGYFDIIIDATDVDVSFDYVIKSSVSSESSISDLKAINYTINPNTSTVQTPYDEVNGISGSVLHNSNNTIIRVYIEWDDSDSQTMDNKADTEVAISDDSKALMDANITFSQKNN